MVTGVILVQADSEPFFLSNFFSGVSRSAGRTAGRHPGGRQTRQFLSSQPHHLAHLAARRPGLRPSRQVKSLHSSRPQQARPALGTPRFRKPARTDPGLRMKLDYGGWEPIGFDENLPAKLKRGIKTADLKSVSEEAGSPIVTIDTAIASAPPAQSDDIPASPAQVASAPYIPSTAENINPNIIYIDSSKAPLSTYSVLEANNPAVAPPYQPPKPVFQAPSSFSSPLSARCSSPPPARTP